MNDEATKPDERLKSEDQAAVAEAVKQILHQVFPIGDASRPPPYERPFRPMSENGNGSIAKLETKVAGLEHQFDAFRDTNEKQNSAINKGISDLSDRIEKRFDRIAAEQSQASNSGRSNTWIVIGIAVSAIIGLLGVGATFWTLAQSPVTTELARHDLDLRELHSTTENREELKADFQILSGGINRNKDIIDTKADARVQDEITKRLEQAAAFSMREHDRLENQVVEIRRDDASRSETAAINDRVTTLSNRLSDFVSKFTALPKYPVLPGGPVDPTPSR